MLASVYTPSTQVSGVLSIPTILSEDKADFSSRLKKLLSNVTKSSRKQPFPG
jgi:hypothetical protein